MGCGYLNVGWVWLRVSKWNLSPLNVHVFSQIPKMSTYKKLYEWKVKEMSFAKKQGIKLFLIALQKSGYGSQTSKLVNENRSNLRYLCALFVIVCYWQILKMPNGPTVLKAWKNPINFNELHNDEMGVTVESGESKSENSENSAHINNLGSSGEPFQIGTCLNVSGKSLNLK